MTWSNRTIAALTLEARKAVLEHRRDAEEHPDSHRGCLWCEDGRFSHWLSDLRQFYRDEDVEVDRVAALYRRAFLRESTPQ